MPKREYLIRNFGLSEQEADQWLAQIEAEQPEFTSTGFMEPDNSDE